MVSSFSNPGFPPVDVHPTRLPAMDARLSAAIDSFEASLRAALRDAIREALDSAFANFTMNFSRDWALLRRDSALRAEGVSDPVPTTSDDTQSIDLGHPGLQGDDNPPRLPSPVQVHSVPPLLSSSPLLRALATPVVKPQSIDSVAAIVSLLGSKTVIPDSVMTTASQLLPDCSASMFSNLCKFSGNEFTPPTFFRKSGAEFMQAQPSMIAHKCQQGLVGMYARYVFDEIPDSCCCVVLDRDMCYCKGIQDKGGGSKFRSPDECRRKLEEKIAKSDYDVSIGCFITKKLHVWCQLPRVLWIRRHEVLRSLIYTLSHGEAKWYWILLFILAYYTGVIVILYEDSLTAKCGWVNWYLVGKFVKKDFYALKLFEEMSKKPLCEKHPMAKFVWSVTNNTGTAEWYNACQEALNNKGTLFHFMLLKTFHLTIHGNSELHIATSWQMLKSFWNASTITDYILEIEFFWEKDIKIVLWVGNATLIFSALESWLVVEHNKRGFAQQWLSLTFSWATSEAVMAKAWSQWYFPYQKTQVPILKAQVKSSSFSPCYRAYHQPYINKKMRAILIDWLIKVHYKFELMGETQFLTVNLIDRFFERQMVIRKQLPLVGVTTMLLACKYEVSVPIVVDFVMKEFDSVFEQLKICMVTLYTHLPTSCNSPREVNDRVKALGHLMSSTIFSPWKAILLEYGFTYVIIELDRFILSRSAMDFDFANMMLFEGRKGPIEMFLREFSSLKQDKPTKPRRHIPQTSEQTMDAPHLIDDYYPNLLVWESCNNLVIALASTIYLWEATNLSALSRIKALDWLGHVDEIVNGPDYKVEFPISDDRLGHPTISLSDATFGYPSGSVLFRNFNFGIALDSRITMVGPNGIGQSKILQLIAGELQPISLTVFHSATVQIALSVSTALRALQPRYMLSGGQRSRDAFAKITTMKLHIILLGEPSNHRDLDVVEALIQGLVLFQGGILTVSNGKHLVSGSMDYKKIPLLQSSWEKSYQPFIHHSDFGNIAIELKTCPFTSVLLQVLMFHNWWSYVSSLAPKVEPSTTLLVSTEEGLVQKVSPQAVLTQQNSHIPSKNNKFTLRLQDSLVNFTANSSRFQVLILTLRTRLFFKGRAML